MFSRSDNNAVVHIVNSSSLLNAVALQFATRGSRYSFTFFAQHVPGVTNQLQVADALSRFCWQLVPHAQPHPTLIPPDLLADLTAPL